jgi:hypothetical protein
MPRGVAYGVSFKDGGTNLLKWRNGGAFDELKPAFAVFSKQVEGGDARIPAGRQIGKASWGI